MKKYFLFFSDSEAFLRFQYICQDNQRSQSNTNLVIANFIGKTLNIALLKGSESKHTVKQLLSLAKDCDEFLIINFKNKLTIDTDFIEFFEFIKNKDYKYLENKIYSCNHDRLELAVTSLLKDISSDVARKDLSFEIKIAREKKDILEYFTFVINYVKLSISDKLLYDCLYIIYYINNTQNFLTKNVFHSIKDIENVNLALEYYSKTLKTLIELYKKGIITYPFYDEAEVIKENQILIEERHIIKCLLNETKEIAFHDKNSILLSDIAYIYHIENEEQDSDSFISAIKHCIEKEIFYFNEGKIYMTKHGDKLYNSILNRNLEEYLVKGF